MKNFIYHFQTKAIYAFLVLLTLSSYTFAQNSISIGSETIKTSAVLYLQGNGSQGLILPIVSNVSGIASPEAGMIVYQSSDNQVYYHDGTSWSTFSGGGGSNQTLTLSGNSLSISDGNSVTLSGVNPSSVGQLFMWDGSQWTATSATAASNGQVLQWNGTSWTPGDLAPSSLLPEGAISGQVLKWNGSSWVAQDDLQGGGAAPDLSDGELMIGNGTSNTSGTVSGDLSMSGSTFTITNGAVTDAKISDVGPDKISQGGALNGQVLQWNNAAGEWQPATVAVTAVGSLSDLTDANVTAPLNGQILAYNLGNLRFENRALAVGDIPNLTLSKITDAGALASANNISSGQIVDGTIQAIDLNNMGAASGEILKWNGTAWAPAADDSGGSSTDDQLLTYTPGTNVLAIEDGNSVDLSDLQQGLSLLNAGTSRTINITDGTGVVLDVADNDNDAANELQSLSLAGTDVTLSNGGGTVSVNDADADATNELISGVAVTGNLIEVTDAGGTQSAAISGVAPASGQVLKWNGTAWVAAADDVGAGGLPGLSNAELVTNDGTSNIPVAVGGDLTMDNAGSFTIQNIQGTSVAIGSPSSGQVLKWDGAQWAPAADAVGAGGLPGLSNAQLVTNDGTSNIGVTVTGDVTFANNGTVTIQPDAVTSAKIADGSITNADISDVDNSKVTGLGALALLGSVGSAQITDGSVSSADIANGTITNIDIADIDPAKINQAGATPSQVLKWDGAQWAPANEAGGSGLPPLTSGQLVTNDGSSDVAVTVSGDITFANNGTVTISAGAVNSAKIADGSITNADILNVDNTKVTGLGALALLSTVTTTQITDGTIAGADLSQMGAASGEVLAWNGTTWAPTASVDGDSDPTNEQNTNFAVNAGNLEITDAGGTLAVPLTSIQDGVDDADNDPTNEQNTNFAVNAGNLEITDAGGTLAVPLTSIQDGVDDADNDPANELITGAVLNVNTLEITDAGGTTAVDLSSIAASQLNDLSDATVTGAAAGEILIGDGSVFNNVSMSGDVSIDAAGGTAIQSTAGDNIVTALNDGGTSGLITETRIAGLGAGVRAILGSNNSGAAAWVSGGSSQLLGTDAGGNLAFYPNTPFLNGSGTPGLISRWDGTGSAFNDSNLRDDNTDITIENGLGLKFGVGSRITGIRSDADGGVRDAGTAADDAGVTELAVRSAIDANAGTTPLLDGEVPVASGGTFVASNLTDNGILNSASDFNLAGGSRILFNGTSGISMLATGNHFLGINSGTSITSGASNVFVGNNTGTATTTADGNVFIGNNAGIANNTGASNSFLGAASGQSNTIGSDNTFVGITAGITNTSGFSNTIIGSGADVGVDGLSNATAIGAGAVVSQSGSLVLGNAVNVGIGTSTPSERLTIVAGGAGESVSLFGDGTGNQLALSLWDEDATNYSGFIAPANINVNYNLEMPADLPAVDGQLLSSNTSGVLSWATPAGISAANGLNVNGATIELGGTLTGATTIDMSTFNLNFSNTGRIIFPADDAGITFGAADATNTPMINMFESGTSNGDRMVLAHSAAFANWGLQYSDALDKFNFVSTGTSVATVDLANRRVGIGTDAPGSDLHVLNTAPAMRIQSSGTVSTSTASLEIGRTSAGTFFSAGALTMPGSTDGLRLESPSLLQFSTNNSTRMTISNAGNVGIGTTAPSTQLHISGTSGNPVRIDGTQPYISFYDGGVYEQFIQTFNDDLYLGSQVGNIVLSENTMVGGTVSPVNTLDVEGGMAVGATYSGTNAAPSNGMIVEGIVGIGMTNPSSPLSVFSDGSGFALDLDGAQPFIRFLDGGVQEHFIQDFGDDLYFGSYIGGDIALMTNRTGIGTTAPTQRLDVNGNVNISGTGRLSFGGVDVLNTTGAPGDIYANIRVVRNASTTSQDGMYIGYGNSGGTAGDLRFYANGTTERMRINASNGYVGIGSTAPNSNLHVSGTSSASMRLQSTTGQAFFRIDKASSASNGWIEYQNAGGADWVVGPYNTGGVASSDNYRIINWGDGASGNDAFTIQSSNSYVGIGTASPNAQLQVVKPTTGIGQEWAFNVGEDNGTNIIVVRTFGNGGVYNLELFEGQAYKPGGGAWGVVSDRRLKRNIDPLQGSLEKLLELQSVTFEYKNPEKVHQLPGIQTGFIAQEVEEVYPEWVTENAEGYKTVTIRGFESMVVQALRELRAEKDAEIARLTAENAVMKRQLVPEVDAEHAQLVLDLTKKVEMLRDENQKLKSKVSTIQQDVEEIKMALRAAGTSKGVTADTNNK